MKVQSRRCVYCTLLREESSFNSYLAPDGKRVFELFDKQCEVMAWPDLVSQFPTLRGLRDILFELSKRAEPAAPSKAWDNNIRVPLVEGEVPDGVTRDGRTLKTAANSHSDRGSKIWAVWKVWEVTDAIEKRIYPDPTKKSHVPRPRCQKGDCNKRGEVGDTFCGRCGEAFTAKTKVEAANG